MILKKWLPWKFIVKQAARAYGFLDPVTLMARLRRFGHPSEVHEPIELIRAGVVFHARGMINTRAIQYNLDWVWPFWIVKQFKPNDASFIPRGFSFSHVNLTHRNWTAVGHPDMAYYPIVDPKGLVTPYFDGWSIDFWMRSDNGETLFPSETENVRQQLDMDSRSLSVSTRAEKSDLRLDTTVWVDRTEQEGARIHIHAVGSGKNGGNLVLSIRPYNPEGIQFVESIAFDSGWFQINGQRALRIDRTPQKIVFSHYGNGDVARTLDDPEQADASAVTCGIGMATAAALFPAGEDRRSEIRVSLPLAEGTEHDRVGTGAEALSAGQAWRTRLSETARLNVPDEKIRFLYDAAVRTLLLLTAEEAYPGPYTYRRFWFRDACLMIHALLDAGLSGRAERLILDFPKRQTMTGYFQSQEGEWDSNGQVLWVAGQLYERTGAAYDEGFVRSLFKGADWVASKRLKKETGSAHQGMLPAGFSAEHLGPNDYYYWDNFWGIAGLRAAARLAGQFNQRKRQERFHRHADALQRCVFDSIEKIPAKRGNGAIPASPYRRMDAGAVGSLVADYPLRLVEPNDPMIMNTVSYLMKNCFHSGAFFQDMIHSGINVYLTLAIAQSLLRAGRPAYRQLIQTVADLASPTGQWPEAIHPFTKGGCMGDGQHGWAAAEWLTMIRNLFVREESGTVLIGSGVFPEWIASGREIAYGPTPVPGGRLTAAFRKSGSALRIRLDGEYDHAHGEIIAHVPGYTPKKIIDIRDPITVATWEDCINDHRR